MNHVTTPKQSRGCVGVSINFMFTNIATEPVAIFETLFLLQNIAKHVAQIVISEMNSEIRLSRSVSFGIHPFLEISTP